MAEPARQDEAKVGGETQCFIGAGGKTFPFLRFLFDREKILP
jgi:hypothetical protein